VFAGPATSCPFALNIQQAYSSFGPGTLGVYSPVTGLVYDMYCRGYDPLVCTGGNNALVEIW
jgi:hypothetical protein